ncbi:pyp-1, partial [Pristionchus pacificus]
VLVRDVSSSTTSLYLPSSHLSLPLFIHRRLSRSQSSGNITMNAVSSSLTSLRLFVSSSTTLGIRSSGMGAVCCSSNLSTVPHPHSLERFPPGHIVGGVRPLRLDPAPQGKRRERLVDTGSENQSTAVTDLPPSTSSHSLPIGQMFRAVTSSLTSDAFAYQQKRPYSTVLVSGMSGDSAMIKYETEEKGSLYTLDYRCYIKGPQGYVSPWHDIPLYADESKKVFNMIVEIPRWTNAKMEMATKEPLSPIKQDEKKGVPRFVHNIFPHHGYIWNYGALPQTWENNEHTDAETGAKGDNDPIDVVEIGSTVHKRGAVVQVKVVGCLALIDDGETDWKLVAIDVTDPLAKDINSMDDVEKIFPGLARATYEWFKTYKIPTGKPANLFAFDGQYKDQAFCYKVIDETHAFWKKLITEPKPELNTLSRVEGAVHVATPDAAAAIVAAAPPSTSDAPLPGDLGKWHFIADSKL